MNFPRAQSYIKLSCYSFYDLKADDEFEETTRANESHESGTSSSGRQCLTHRKIKSDAQGRLSTQQDEYNGDNKETQLQQSVIKACARSGDHSSVGSEDSIGTDMVVSVDNVKSKCSKKILLKASKEILRILRHDAANLGLVVGENGYVSIDELISKFNNKSTEFNVKSTRKPLALTRELVDKIFELVGVKDRLEINPEGNEIRAFQGHGLALNMTNIQVPPDCLYHGTALTNEQSIGDNGLNRQNRAYVHLSDSLELAQKVGLRHGKVVIVYKVLSKMMYENGIEFIKSDKPSGDVWLVGAVPPNYLEKL